MRTRLLADVLCVAAAAACAGCAPDFLPESLVADLRILAVTARASTPAAPSTSELGPVEGCTPSSTDSCYGTVTLSATAVLPDGSARPVEWAFCPFSIGSQAGYACAVPQCEEALPAGAVVTDDPVLRAFRCLATLQQGGGLPPGIPAQLPERAEVLYRARATAGGEVREAVYRLGIWRDGPPLLPDGSRQARNRNPAITQVRIGAEVQPGPAPASIPRGAKVEVCADLDPGLVDAYLDASGGRAVEQQVISFFSTAGRFDFDRANGPSGCAVLEAKELPAGPVDGWLWVVARDLRGGAAVAGPWPIAFP